MKLFILSIALLLLLVNLQYVENAHYGLSESDDLFAKRIFGSIFNSKDSNNKKKPTSLVKSDEEENNGSNEDNSNNDSNNESNDDSNDSNDNDNDNNNDSNDDNDNNGGYNGGSGGNFNPNQGPFVEHPGIFIPLGGRSLNLCDGSVISAVGFINEKIKNKLIKVCGFNSAGYIANKLTGFEIGKTIFALWDLFGSSNEYKKNDKLAKLIDSRQIY